MQFCVLLLLAVSGAYIADAQQCATVTYGLLQGTAVPINPGKIVTAVSVIRLMNTCPLTNGWQLTVCDIVTPEVFAKSVTTARVQRRGSLFVPATYSGIFYCE